MYGFCRLGVRPAPSTGAVCVSNGLATATSMNAKNVAIPPSTGTTQAVRSRSSRRLSGDRERAVAGQDEQPEQQRSLLPAPERAQRVRRRQRRGSCATRRTTNEKSWRTSAVASTAAATSVEPKLQKSALRAESASRRRFVTRGDRAGDERVDRQPEADDERRAAEVGHQQLRLRRRGLAVYFDGHFVRMSVRRRAGRRRSVPRDDDAAADLEERRRRGAVVDDRDRRRFVAVDVLQPEAQPVALCESPVTGPTTVPTTASLPRVRGDLARRQRRRRVAGDGRVEQEHGEHRRDREGDDQPRGTARGHGRKSSRASASAATGCGLRAGHAIAVIGTKCAGRVLGQRVAVALAVGGAHERGDDVERPLADARGLAPEVGEPQVDVELEQVDPRSGAWTCREE